MGSLNLVHTEPLCAGLCCTLASQQPTLGGPDHAIYYMEEFAPPQGNRQKYDSQRRVSFVYI